MIVINYFILQVYKGIGIQIEDVSPDHCKSQFLIDNQLYEVQGKESKEIKLYNRLVDLIKEAVETLIKFVKSIYKTNNLVFKKEEEDTVYECLVYELSDIIIHYIYTNESPNYRESIDIINEYMIEFIGRFAKVKGNNVK